MRLEWTPRFTEEVERFDLRYTCPDCAHYLAERGECVHGWPLADHLYPPGRPGPARAEVVFCKEFELR